MVNLDRDVSYIRYKEALERLKAQKEDAGKTLLNMYVVNNYRQQVLNAVDYYLKQEAREAYMEVEEEYGEDQNIVDEVERSDA